LLFAKLQDILRQKVKQEDEIDMADYFSRLTLELISQVGFGHSFGALQGEGNEYAHTLKEVVFVDFLTS